MRGSFSSRQRACVWWRWLGAAAAAGLVASAMPITPTAKVVVFCAEAVATGSKASAASAANCDWRCYDAFIDSTVDSNYVLGSQLMPALTRIGAGCRIPITVYMTFRLQTSCLIHADGSPGSAAGASGAGASGVTTANGNSGGAAPPASSSTYMIGVPQVRNELGLLYEHETPVYTAVVIESSELAQAPCLKSVSYSAGSADLNGKSIQNKFLDGKDADYHELLQVAVCGSATEKANLFGKEDEGQRTLASVASINASIPAPVNFGFTSLSINVTEWSDVEGDRYSYVGTVAKVLRLDSSSQCQAEPRNVELYYTSNYTLNTSHLSGALPHLGGVAGLLLTTSLTILASATIWTD